VTDGLFSPLLFKTRPPLRGAMLGGGVGPACAPEADGRVTAPHRLGQMPGPGPVCTLDDEGGPLDFIVGPPAAMDHLFQEGALPIRERQGHRARPA
jgi:hypothetical protein